MDIKERKQFLVFLIFLTLLSENVAREFELGPCYLQFLEPCANNSIQFFLFSSDKSDDEPFLLDNLEPFLPTDYNETITKSYKVIIHGYGGHLDFNGSKQIRNAYIQNPSTEVIVVDWSRLAKLPCYPSAAINTKQAGECTAQFLLAIQRNNVGFRAANIHAIGFSLGAHVASFASNAIEKAVGAKFRRITGLDPALPFFATARPHWKLDSTDADFIDIIHTNAAHYGKLENCGHTDFYMNNGQFQPTCSKAKNENLCSHMMALEYYAESINSKVGFYGFQCQSYFQYVFGWCNLKQKLRNKLNLERVRMGEYCEQKPEGIVFVNTYKKAPYAMG